MDALVAALVMAVSALPAVGIAAWFSRDPRPTSPTLALHMALVSIAMLLAALAMYRFGDDPAHARWIALALALVVNALVISLFFRVRRVMRNGRRP